MQILFERQQYRYYLTKVWYAPIFLAVYLPATSTLLSQHSRLSVLTASVVSWCPVTLPIPAVVPKNFT